MRRFFLKFHLAGILFFSSAILLSQIPARLAGTESTEALGTDTLYPSTDLDINMNTSGNAAVAWFLPAIPAEG